MSGRAYQIRVIGKITDTVPERAAPGIVLSQVQGTFSLVSMAQVEDAGALDLRTPEERVAEYAQSLLKEMMAESTEEGQRAECEVSVYEMIPGGTSEDPVWRRVYRFSDGVASASGDASAESVQPNRPGGDDGCACDVCDCSPCVCVGRSISRLGRDDGKPVNDR